MDAIIVINAPEVEIIKFDRCEHALRSTRAERSEERQAIAIGWPGFPGQ
jgi:hypothetical protein